MKDKLTDIDGILVYAYCVYIYVHLAIVYHYPQISTY